MVVQKPSQKWVQSKRTMSLAPQVQSALLLVYLYPYTTSCTSAYRPHLWGAHSITRKQPREAEYSMVVLQVRNSEVCGDCCGSQSTVYSGTAGILLGVWKHWSTPQGVHMPGRKSNAELRRRADFGLILSECWEYSGAGREKKAFSRRFRLSSLLQRHPSPHSGPWRRDKPCLFKLIYMMVGENVYTLLMVNQGLNIFCKKECLGREPHWVNTLNLSRCLISMEKSSFLCHVTAILLSRVLW